MKKISLKEEISLEDIKLIIQVRLYMYDVLRRFFIEEPSLDYLAYCVSQGIFNQYPLQENSSEIKTGILDIKRYLDEHDVTACTEDYEKLHWDYTRMFIGPMSLPAPPWASYYLERDQLLFQNITFQVKSMYRKYGLGINDHSGREADDHIGLELDFLYQLCQLTAQELERELIDEAFTLLRDQKQFIDGHLLAYLSQFCTRVISSAETKFFRGLAKVLRGSIKVDSELVGDLIIWKAEG